MSVLFGTNCQFDLQRLPFSTKGAFLSIYQDSLDKNLYFSIARSEPIENIRASLLRISLVDETGADLPFIYECEPSKLTVKCEKGTAEFTYEDAQTMLVRVKGTTLRVYCDLEMHEGGIQSAPGQVELAFNLLGGMAFYRIAGQLTSDEVWNFRECRPYPFHIDITPTGSEPALAAVYEYYSTPVIKETHADFDDACAKLENEFSEFCKKYPQVPYAYRDMAQRAIWHIWTSIMGPRGSIKEPIVWMHKLFLNRAFGWHQAFHAMAMKNDTRLAFDILMSMFAYQDSAGGIPDNITDLDQIVWICTKPPVYGLAACYMLENFDLSVLTREDYEDMYTKLEKFAAWWLVHHDHAKTGCPAYYHPDESGYDEATLFEAGLPLISPDLVAYIVGHCDALSRLADILGKTEDAKRWSDEGDRLLDILVNDLWDGEKFRAKKPQTGEYFECGSLALLQPVMLGRRLPSEIVKKIASRVSDPKEFLTDHGIASEHLESSSLVMRSFTRGPVIAPTQMLIIWGLFDAGEIETARMLAARFLNAMISEGLILGTTPYRVEPRTYTEIPVVTGPRSLTLPFNPWMSSIFLFLADTVMGQQ